MILIGTDDGIYRWSDGAAWPVFHALQERSVVNLSAPATGFLLVLDRQGQVLESEDNGLSWRELPLPAGVTAATAVTAAGMPPAIVAAARPMNLYRRELGAPTPRAAVAPVPAGAGFAPVALGRARGLAHAASSRLAPGRFGRTDDAEVVALAGWSRMGAPSAPKDTVAARERGLAVTASEIRSVVEVPGDPPTLFATVTGSGLWSSGDGGMTWSKSEGLPPVVHGVRPVPGRPSHIWAATADGCRFSTDGGKTWEDRSAGLEAARDVRAVEIRPDQPDTLLAGCAPAGALDSAAAARDGLNFGLYESANGGKSWSRVRKSLPETFETDTITDVRYDPEAPDNAVVALGSGEMWLTRNGGAYWGPLARQIRAARVLCAIG